MTGGLSRRDAPRIDLDGDGVAETPAPLFCSGQSLLADGQLFVAGGNLGNPASLGGSTPNWRGLDRAYTFDPWSETWREQPRPRHGRWYPSQVELADGRIAILAGYDEVGLGAKNLELEVFTPAAERGGVGTMTYHPAGNRDTGFYPHLFTLRDGRVFLGGPVRGDSGLLDPAGLNSLLPGSAWTNFTRTTEDRVGGNAILWPQGVPGDMRVTLLGGYRYLRTATRSPTPRPSRAAGCSTARASLACRSVAPTATSSSSRTARWSRSAAAPASAATTPTSTTPAATSASSRSSCCDPGSTRRGRSGRRSASGARITRPRCCCPTAGSCRRATTTGTSATQARPQGGSPMDVGEIYSPPYLFDGDQLAPRPLIEDAPVAVPYGAPFAIRVRDAARAVLVAPGATTHGADMNQRLVVLETLRTRDGVGVDVRAPSGPGAAPPGYYMLFVFDNAGTPSVARWVRVGADAPAPARAPGPGRRLAVPSARAARWTAPPRASTLKLTRRGRRLALRIGLSEPGRADVELRARRAPRQAHAELPGRAAHGHGDAPARGEAPARDRPRPRHRRQPPHGHPPLRDDQTLTLEGV